MKNLITKLGSVLRSTVLLSCLIIGNGIFAQQVTGQNIGFETGNTNNWTKSGTDVTVSTGLINVTYGDNKYWTIRPYGTYMAQLYPSGSVTFDSTTSSLGLTATENTAIKNYLTQQANSGGGGNPTPTNASWMKRSVTLQAGTVYKFAWNYLSTDYTPFNDGSMVSLTHNTNQNIIPTINNKQQRYGLLGFTNPGTGEYATGSYGSTGWQLLVFTVPEDGDYTLGFATFNLGDTALSPMLFIDEIQGTTELNGTSFGPIAPNPGSSAPVTDGGGGPTYTSDITPEQTLILNAAKSRVAAVGAGNKIMLETKSGSSSNNITIEQSGNYNLVQGIGGGYATIDGSLNTLNIKQGDIAGKNLIELSVTGGTNSVTINQARTATGLQDGAESGGHYNGLIISGSSNTITANQRNDGASNSGHFSLLSISGSNNNLTLTQANDNEKKFFGSLTGSGNIFNVSQSGLGSHYLDLTLTGNGHNANVTQQGSGTHKATINLSNVGGASTLTLMQQGTTGQVYNITQQCANLSGCSVSVTQGP